MSPRRISIFAVAALSLLVFAACGNSGNSPTSTIVQTPAQTATAIVPTPTADVPCESTEKLTYHVHSHLSIFVNGQPVTVPEGIGIKSACIYWLHTHDATGIIHVEAPSKRSFALGQFFQIYGQPLSSTALLANRTDPQHEIRAFVDGKPFTGDPATIPLGDRTDIVLEYGPPFPTATPVPFKFPPGF